MYDWVFLSIINYVIKIKKLEMSFLAQLVTLSVSQWVIFWFQHNDYRDYKDYGDYVDYKDYRDGDFYLDLDLDWGRFDD